MGNSLKGHRERAECICCGNRDVEHKGKFPKGTPLISWAGQQ